MQRDPMSRPRQRPRSRHRGQARRPRTWPQQLLASAAAAESPTGSVVQAAAQDALAAELNVLPPFPQPPGGETEGYRSPTPDPTRELDDGQAA